MFASLELARRLEKAEGSAGAAFVQARGGSSTWTEIAGAYAMFDGVDSPLTQTFGLGMMGAADDAVLDRVEEFFKVRQSPICHEVCPLAGVPLLQSLAERGYAPFELSNVLFAELPVAVQGAVARPAFAVRVAGSTDADAYVRAAAAGWSESREVAEMVVEMGRVMLAADGYTGFLVEKDANVVATAGLVIHENVGLLAGGSTMPHARGQGAQRAVLSARLEHAANSGCDLAMMVAEPGSASQRNAERSGFRIAYTRTKWRLADNKRSMRNCEERG